ncbi:MAG: 3-hydroxyisobutyrate dehydrogenase [Proteobacteria bacterium]|nr:3-hydroxyisobutyrate dehydrogenase [Pseudomonadota bacterium]
MQQIGFVGLGNMGGPMALNLVKAGYHLTAYDVMPEAVHKLVAAGATAAKTVADAVSAAEIVITMLPGDTQVKQVYMGDKGVLNSGKKKTLLIDCSTISAQVAQDVAIAAATQGFDMIDAPVSGGTSGAASATLTFIIGGKNAVVERAKPVLEKMGKNFFHAGDHGAGQIAKICNNMLLAVLMIGTSEALNLGVAYGLDPKVISNIISKSSGRNWALEMYNPMPGVMDNVPSARQYSGGFGTGLMVKDLGLAEEAALAKKAPTPLGSLARQLYQLHDQAGNRSLDFSSIIQMIGKR